MFTFNIFKLLIKILYSRINMNKNYLENDALNSCVSDSANYYYSYSYEVSSLGDSIIHNIQFSV